MDLVTVTDSSSSGWFASHPFTLAGMRRAGRKHGSRQKVGVRVRSGSGSGSRLEFEVRVGVGVRLGLGFGSGLGLGLGLCADVLLINHHASATVQAIALLPYRREVGLGDLNYGVR